MTEGVGAKLIANNVTIKAHNLLSSAGNTFAFGAAARVGGYTIVNGGTIDVDSTNVTQPRAYGANSAGTLDLTGVVLNTVGTYSHGVVAAGGTANVYNGSVRTTGGTSAGLYSSGSGGDSTLNATGTTITSTMNSGVWLEVGGGTAGFAVTANVNNVTISAGLNGLNAGGAATRQINAVSSTINSTSTGATATGAAIIRLKGGYDPGGGAPLLGGTSITTTAGNAYGVTASGAGSLIDSSDTWTTTILTNGATSHGAYAVSNGRVQLTNDSVTTKNSNANGAYALSGGTLVLNNNTIETQGTGANGIAVSGTASSAIVDGNNQVTTGNTNAHGFIVLAGASKTFNSAVGNIVPTFTIKGAGSALLAASGISGATPSTLTLNNVQATNSGAFADTIGVLAQTSGVVNLQNNTRIEISGANTFAAVASQGTVTATDTFLTSTGGNGVRVNNNGRFSGTNTTVTASNMGFAVTTGTVALPNTVTFTNSTLDAGGDGFNANAGVGVVTVQQSTIQNGSVLLNALTNSNLTLNVSDTTLNGNTIVDASSTGRINLVNSPLTGNAFNATSISVDATSRWTMNDDSDTGSLSNAGTVGFVVGATPGKTLTAHPTYAATNGQLALNTYLGDDSSPSDVLVITGMPTGVTTINVTNVGGPGAATTNGILVVDTPAGSPNNAFTLAGGSITAGYFVYTLHQGTDGKWYLRATPGPRISLSKTANVTTLTPGSTIIYTVTLGNAVSVSAASNVVVSDPIPAGITSLAWTCTGTCPNASGSGALNETIPTLAAGATTTYTITAVVSATPPVSVVNTVTATVPGALCVSDNTPSPCTSSAAVPPVPIVEIGKTANVSQVQAGGSVIYTVVVTNNSSVNGNGTVVSDPLPAGLSAYSWTCTAIGGSACPNASGSGALNETIATFPGHTSVTYQITATVSQTPPASVTNTATANVPNGGLCTPGNTPSPCTATNTITTTQLVAVPALGGPWLAMLVLILAGCGIRGWRGRVV